MYLFKIYILLFTMQEVSKWLTTIKYKINKIQNINQTSKILNHKNLKSFYKKMMGANKTKWQYTGPCRVSADLFIPYPWNRPRQLKACKPVATLCLFVPFRSMAQIPIVRAQPICTQDSFIGVNCWESENLVCDYIKQ